MKICLINNLYKPLARGGAEKVVEIMAQELKEAGHEIFIITTKPAFKKLDHADKCDYYIPSLYYNLKKVPKFLRLYWHFFDMFNLKNFFKIKQILKKEKPELIITHNLKGVGFLTPSVIKKLKIKHIHFLHDIQLIHPSGLMIYGEEKRINNIFAKIYSFACKALFDSPDIVISPSKWLLDFHVSRKFFKNSKKIILPYPLFLQKISLETEKSQKLEQNKIFRFVFVGQIEEHKGVLFLINTFKKFVNQSNIECSLLIIGDGSKFNKALHLANGYPAIKFLGRLEKDSLRLELRKSDVLIVPSLCYENSPAVIFEAFDASLPVIAADIGGIGELLQNNKGVLFKPGDEDDLIKKIKWMIDNYLKLKRQVFNKDVQNNFINAEVYAQKLVKLIK